jgi:hypothetical protein
VRRSMIVAAAQRLRRISAVRRIRRSSLHVKLLLVALLGVAFGGTAAWWVYPPEARAATCDVKYNVVASDSTSNFSHNGERVANPGMYIYDYVSDCAHVSSIEVDTTTNDEAEVGWIDPSAAFSPCLVIGDNKPHILTTYVSGGVYSCRQWAQLTPNQSDDFSVWGNSSDVWTWSHDGSNVRVVTLDFRAGQVLTNGERHTTFESAEALFNGLQYGTSPNWVSWPQSVCLSDDDPQYANQLHSATNISVSQSAPQC